MGGGVEEKGGREGSGEKRRRRQDIGTSTTLVVNLWLQSVMLLVS